MWIQTLSGQKFDFEDPDPKTIIIEDIAHALSMLCRYVGHVHTHLSVAQHSVLVSLRLPPEHRFQGLMHDSAEAYVGDLSAPLKRLMRKDGVVIDYERLSMYDEIELRVWNAIAFKYGIPKVLHPSVKEADLRMLMTEKKLLGKEPQSWGIDAEPYPMTIDPWPAPTAYRIFMDRFNRLYALQYADAPRPRA